MKATLKLELFGDNTSQQFKLYTGIVNYALGDGVGDAVFGKHPSNCWVAEIVGKHEKFKFDRRFLKGKKDYSKANSVGSRGIYLWFVLESSKYYEVKEQLSWRGVDRYFVKVTDSGDIVRVGESEIDIWLKDHSE